MGAGTLSVNHIKVKMVIFGKLAIVCGSAKMLLGVSAYSMVIYWYKSSQIFHHWHVPWGMITPEKCLIEVGNRLQRQEHLSFIAQLLGGDDSMLYQEIIGF